MRDPTDPRAVLASRRLLLSAALGLPVAAAAGCRSNADAGSAVAWVTAARQADGRDTLLLHDAAHRERARFVVGSRPHGTAVDPVMPSRVVAFARRPGTEAWVLDLAAGRLAARFESASGRHFYGHGAFTADGAQLFTAENDVARGTGVIVVRDATDWRVLDERPAHGIGPHEIRLLPDGRTLAIAVGGIRSHPSRGRSSADIAAMAPALNYVDVASGRLLGQYRPPDRRQGIRHLDVAPDGTVLVAIQHEGDEAVPLLARHRGEDRLAFAHAEPGDWAALSRYVGSLRVAGGDGRHAIASSPRGNALVFWDWRENRIEAALPMLDVCGVAIVPDGSAATATSGAGEIREYARRDGRWQLAHVIPGPGPRYDNHLQAVG